MDLYYADEHTSCSNCVSHTRSGFKLLKVKKGEKSSEQISDHYNLLIFVLEGEIEFSCNKYTKRKFIAGEFVFAPQSTIVSGKALMNSKLIVLLLDYTAVNLCDKYTMTQYAALCPDIDYDFRGLKFRSPLTEFLTLLDIFLEAGVNCVHLHEIKMKELFIIFRVAYSRNEIAELFYPILGDDIDFKASVLAHYRTGYSAKDIANAMALGESNFSRKFKQEFKISYYQWMLKQKAQHIKYKLTYSNVAIKDIIYEYNFSNFSHFNRFCKEHFGHTPSELIKSLRSSETTK